MIVIGKYNSVVVTAIIIEFAESAVIDKKQVTYVYIHIKN